MHTHCKAGRLIVFRGTERLMPINWGGTERLIVFRLIAPEPVLPPPISQPCLLHGLGNTSKR